MRLGYLSQEVAELPPSAAGAGGGRGGRRGSPARQGQELTASQLAERFGFAGNRQWTPVGDLSGGERRRLQLLRLLMAEPNVLLLDEPTNDLDIDTLTALEDLLDGWPGTLVVVSHDRYFLERVCDTVVALLGDGRCADLPGGVDEYLARRAARRGARCRRPARRRAAGRRRRGAAARAPRTSGRRRRSAARLERRMDKLDAARSQLHEQLAAAATDYAKAPRWTRSCGRCRRSGSRSRTEWLAAAELAEG